MNDHNSILAKPSGVTLKQHQSNVASEGALIIESLNATCLKYKNKTGFDFAGLLKIACEHHDDGKRYVDWQKACQDDFNDFISWQSNTGGTFTEYANEKKVKCGKHIMKAGVRHEFKSIAFDKRREQPLLSKTLQVAIAAHHGRLCVDQKERWIKEREGDLWNRLERLSYTVNEQRDFEFIANKHYQYSGIRGILQLADHRASAKELNIHIPQYQKFKYIFPHKNIRTVQRLVEENWDRDLLLVRAPTGAGKTDASLLWASLQINHNRADRVIIAMPTRFTSNALAISVSESLSDTGLYHSSAWFNRFQNKVESGEFTRKEAEMMHESARLLQTPVTVCTIDHLLMALTLTREDHHLITFNLANSCLVIDEADFYDEFTQANILVLLKLLKYWNVPVLIMSATLPENVIANYKSIGYSVENILEDRSDSERDRFVLKEIVDYTEIQEIEYLLYKMIEKGNGIIYANTVDKAVAFYTWFKNNCDKSVPISLYHSRFTESDKMSKEQEILSMLGKKAWSDGCASGIVILTQIGEMSINISSEIMISEICPIDRLIQRVGRLCRFDKKIGELYIINPFKNQQLYPAPYGKYEDLKKAWIPCYAFIKTKDLLECRKYNFKDIIRLLNSVYDKINGFSSKASENARILEVSFVTNWLILPAQKVCIDDKETNNWKSRDMDGQETVLASKPQSDYFSNYMDFQIWKNSNSIELPLYMIRNGVKNHMIDLIKIQVKDNEEQCYVIREGFYRADIGVNLNKNDDFIL